MIQHVYTPCPHCGHRELWQAVIDRGIARECMAAGCGWFEITPLEGSRARS
jgi:hypothetical protein